MADNTVDFRLSLQDDLSKQMKKTEKLTKNSLESMSKEQVNLNKKVAEQERLVVKLQNKLHTASKSQQKDLKEEIRLNKLVLKERKNQLRIEKRNNQIKTKTTFGDRIGKSASGGTSSTGLIGKFGGAAGIAAGATATIIAGVQLNNMMVETEKINSRLRASFDLSGDSLIQMNAKVKTLSKTFGEDYTDIIQSANTLSKEMGITGSEAMSLIEQGFKKGANNSGEFLDIMKEYPTLMDKAGISAEEFVAITTEMVNKGMYSDKGIDAIKEGGESLLENNKGTQEAIKLLPKQIQEQIKLSVAQGNTFDAMKLISGELKKMSTDDKFTVTKAIFGAPGLDAGDKMISTLSDINSNLSSVKDTLSEFEKVDLKLSEEWNLFVESIIATDGVLGGFFNTIKSGLADALGVVNNYSKLGVVINDNMKEQSEQYFAKIMDSFENKSNRVSKSAFINAQMASLEGKIVTATELERTSSERLDVGGVKTAQNQLGVYGLTLRKLKEFSSTSKVTEKANQLNRTLPTINADSNKQRTKSATRQTQKDLTRIETSKAVKSLTINIDNLNEGGIDIITTNISESPAQLQKMFTEMLINVVNQSGNQILNK